MTKHGKRTMALMQQRCSASQAHAFVMNVVTTIPGHNPQTLWDEIARRYKDCINITAHAPLDPPHHLSTATFDQIKRHHADMIAHWTDIWKRLRATGNAGTAPAATTATAGPSTAHSSARDATAASQTLAHVHAPAPKAARSCPRPRAAVHLDRDSIILLASYTYNVDCTKPEYDFYWRFLRGLFYVCVSK